MAYGGRLVENVIQGMSSQLFRDLYLQRWDDEVWECDTLQSSERQEHVVLEKIIIFSPADRDEMKRLGVNMSTGWSKDKRVLWCLADCNLPIKLRGHQPLLDIDWRNYSLNYYADMAGGDLSRLAQAVASASHRCQQRRYVALLNMIQSMASRRFSPAERARYERMTRERFAEKRWDDGDSYITLADAAKYLSSYRYTRDELNPLPPVNWRSLNPNPNCRCVLRNTEDQTTMAKRTDLTASSKLVRVTFDENGAPKRYQYLHEGSVAVGDRLVVDSPYGGLKLVTVREIDADLSMVTGSTKWTVQRVDTTAYVARAEEARRRAETASLIRREIAQVRANAEARIREEMLSRYAPELAGLQARLAELVG
jgi:hypothetical protein